MAVREIAAQFEHTCDGCGKVENQSSRSRPKYWTGLKIEADAYDFQGCAVANAGVDRVLCGDCTRIVHKAVNESIVAARATLSRIEEDGK